MNKMNALTRGVVVFAILAVLTVIEYFLGTSAVPAVFLWLIALVKAGLVLWYFMHLARVFKPYEGDHE
jgi:heme/copper-type cytochrome/quinol oxidase subunit 4